MYWLMDPQGQIDGPMSLEVLGTLAASGRISGVTRGSRDGKSWAPLSQFPELSALVAPPALRAQHAKDEEEARRTLERLERLRGLPDHAVFGLPPEAEERELKRAFLEMARRYHPARLPKNVHPELLKAHMAMFQLLSERKLLLEQRLARGRSGAPAIPSARATATPAQAHGGPTAETVLTLRRGATGMTQATVNVSRTSWQIFTQHKLVNLTTRGVFFAGEGCLPLGTSLELVFRFDSPAKEIRCRGSVVVENAAGGAQLRGFGVQLQQLTEPDRAFIAEYVGKQRQAAGAR